MSKLGSHLTDETKAKMSVSQMGNTSALGHHHSDESKVKMSIAKKGKPNHHKGRIQTFETRAKISVTEKGKIGRPCSLETRVKISVAQMQEKGNSWKGGQIEAMRRAALKYRGLGFVPLNEWFVGCAAHHVDYEQVIFIPEELNQSIPHSLKTGKNMAQINAEAYNFLFKQEVEVAMKVQGGQNG